MNLIGEPWIPVMYENGESRVAGLRQLYEDASSIKDLALPPPERISVTRLLLCITQAALDGPEDEGDWLHCKEKIIPASIEYLQKRLDRFNLYGKKPFLQVEDLEEKEKDKSTLDNLDFGLASGTNPTLFDHEASPKGRPHSKPWIVLKLLTYQNFALRGTLGKKKWKGKDTSKGRESNDAPCVAGTPLFTIIRGENMLDSIHLNLVTKEEIKKWQPLEWGFPIWDSFPDAQDAPITKHIVKSYLGRLVPLSRAIKIYKDSTRVLIGNGLSYPKFPLFRDPMATVLARKEHYTYLKIDTSRHPWRDLNSILQLKMVGVLGGPPALKNLRACDVGTFDLWVGGIQADAQRHKITDSGEWTFPLHSDLLRDGNGITTLKKGVSFADRKEKVLRAAITAYCKKFLVKSKKDASELKKRINKHALAFYWNLLDTEHKTLITLANERLEANVWFKVVASAAQKSYEAACPCTNARQIEAFVIGKQELFKKGGQNE